MNNNFFCIEIKVENLSFKIMINNFIENCSDGFCIGTKNDCSLVSGGLGRIRTHVSTYLATIPPAQPIMGSSQPVSTLWEPVDRFAHSTYGVPTYLVRLNLINGDRHSGKPQPLCSSHSLALWASDLSLWEIDWIIGGRDHMMGANLNKKKNKGGDFESLKRRLSANNWNG